MLRSHCLFLCGAHWALGTRALLGPVAAGEESDVLREPLGAGWGALPGVPLQRWPGAGQSPSPPLPGLPVGLAQHSDGVPPPALPCPLHSPRPRDLPLAGTPPVTTASLSEPPWLPLPSGKDGIRPGDPQELLSALLRALIHLPVLLFLALHRPLFPYLRALARASSPWKDLPPHASQ